MGIDWQIFYDAAHAVLNGMSPYTVPGYFNPPLLAYLLAPTTIMPFSIWMPFMITVSCFALAMMLRTKRKLAYLLLSPFTLQALTWGSVDLLLVGGMSVSWGFLMLKPQLLFIALPVILQRRARRHFLIAGLMLIAYPPHYEDWFKATQTTEWAHGTSNLASMGVPMLIVGLLLTIVALRYARTAPRAKLILTAFSPVSRVHDYLVAWEELATFKMLAFSWTLFVVWYHLETRNELIYVLIGLLVFIRELWKRQVKVSPLTKRLVLNDHIFYPREPYVIER